MSATIGRNGDVPLEVAIAPGTQFWAQAGGRQGQATIGQVPVDLTGRQVARLTLHTCCTNLGLPPATRADLMLPVPCSDGRMAALLGQPGIAGRPHMAVQAAVWALASDPSRRAVRRALLTEAGVPRQERERFAAEMLAAAADLLRQANLAPEAYRLFR